jgi:hypothetical protein
MTPINMTDTGPTATSRTAGVRPCVSESTVAGGCGKRSKGRATIGMSRIVFGQRVGPAGSNDARWRAHSTQRVLNAASNTSALMSWVRDA